MSERRFDIIFDGSVINGADPIDVKAKLKALFKLDDAGAEKLFTGEPMIIKKNIDRKTATQYQSAMNNAGAKIQIVLHRSQTSGATPSAPSAPSTPSSDTTSTHPSQQAGEPDLAPRGADLLNESEKAVVEAAKINTDHISLENASGNPFMDALDNAREPTSELATPRYPESQITNAPDMDFTSEEVINQNIIQNKARQDAFIEEQTARHHLTLEISEAGEDLLKPEEKTPEVIADVDISALSLTPNE